MSRTSVQPQRPSAALSRNQLLELYYYVRLARDVEERLVILFRQSRVIGGLYRSLGQEGESVATAYALERRDAILPLIRNMGALMTMGVRPREIFLQYMARGDSNSRGRDLNIHVVHLPDEGANQPVIVGPISMLGQSAKCTAPCTLHPALCTLHPVRVASADTPVPYAPALEAAFLPGVEKVVAAAKKLVRY